MVWLRKLLDQPWSSRLCQDWSQDILWIQNIEYVLCKDHGDAEVEISEG